MTLAAIVIAFLLDQVRPAGPGHAVAEWPRRWMTAITGAADAGGPLQGWLAWALAAVAPALAAGLIGGLCWWVAGWFGQLAWAVAVLYFTLGFRQFSHHGTAIRDALAAGDEAQARDLLAQWQGGAAAYADALPQPLSARGSVGDCIACRAIAVAVLSAHRWVFGVLFWFCLLAPLGLAPAGAVLYRYAELAARRWRDPASQGQPAASAALRAATQTAWHVIDWLPVRVTALAFAVVGNFEDAIAAWRQRGANRAGQSQANDAVLLAAAAGALGMRLDDAAAAPGANAGQPATPAQPVTTPVSAAGPVCPPDCEPAAPPDQATAASTDDAPGALGAEPDVRHFAQVAGLLWRGVALWLLLLVLLTLAHGLG